MNATELINALTPLAGDDVCVKLPDGTVHWVTTVTTEPTGETNSDGATSRVVLTCD